VIEKDSSLENILNGKVVLITGAGGGIGLEAAKAFAYMGARIIVAEIDREKGLQAEMTLNSAGSEAEFYEVDLADADHLQKMTQYIEDKYGCPDVIFNNATITKMGAVDDVDISFWDRSYAVNLRAPVFLAHTFLPTMKNRNSGIIVFVSSSGASPYMGAYEVFKTAQVELSSTIAMELENSAVYTYTIGPGLVKTETAMHAIEIVATRMGMSINEFYAMNSQHIIDAESAGTGFALSVLNAAKYHGQEIGAIQVLMDFHMTDTPVKQKGREEIAGTRDYGQARTDEQVRDNELAGAVEQNIPAMSKYLGKILATYEDQYNGWKSMNIFEKQWVLRDLKKSMGLSADQVYNKLRILNDSIKSGSVQAVLEESDFFDQMKRYWEHQLKLLRGYEKDKDKLEENSRIIMGWIADIEKLQAFSK